MVRTAVDRALKLPLLAHRGIMAPMRARQSRTSEEHPQARYVAGLKPVQVGSVALEEPAQEKVSLAATAPQHPARRQGRRGRADGLERVELCDRQWASWRQW